LLKRTAVPLMELEVPKSIDGVRKQYVEMAEVLGERSKGESVVADIDARLAKLAAVPAGRRPRTVVLNPNGVTVGQETLANEIMTRAGLENIAASLRIDNYGQIPLEIIVTQNVEVLIVSANRDGPPAMATGYQAPGDRADFRPDALVVMPTRMWTCGGPAIVDAIELLMGWRTMPQQGRARMTHAAFGTSRQEWVRPTGPGGGACDPRGRPVRILALFRLCESRPGAGIP
jgi:iron complex transport system substrate-binding protein